MNALNFSMKHTCQVISTTQDHRLAFTLGSAVFTVGSLLTGVTSEATGTIKSMVVSSGSWASNNAVGYLILSNVTGTFESEIISDEGTIPGSATASGPAIPQTDGVGTPTKTTSSTSYSCKFSNIAGNSGGISNYDSGAFIVSVPLVFLPADAVVSEGDYITSTETGYNRTYEVIAVDPLYNFFDNTIDHIEAALKAVEKRG